jgi:hypothetical protein
MKDWLRDHPQSTVNEVIEGAGIPQGIGWRIFRVFVSDKEVVRDGRGWKLNDD